MSKYLSAMSMSLAFVVSPALAQGSSARQPAAAFTLPRLSYAAEALLAKAGTWQAVDWQAVSDRFAGR